MRLTTITQLAKREYAVDLVRMDMYSDWIANRRWGSQAPFPRKAQAVEYWSNRAGRSIRKIAHAGVTEDTIEAISHELAHLALDSHSEPDCYELQISWLPMLVDEQRIQLQKGILTIIHRNLWIAHESRVVTEFYDKNWKATKRGPNGELQLF